MMRSLAALLLLPAALLAQAPPPPANDSGADTEKPLVSFDFDGPEAGVPKGTETVAGPRPPAFPAFPPKNLALVAGGKGLTVRESDLPGVNLRFATGDAITLEAWVKLRDLKDGGYAYIIGKGRTRKAGFPEQNQNYALRLKGVGKQAAPSFLFASAAADGQAAGWHRWTATTGFPVDAGWHHVAVAYTFGKPDSVRGYVDGKVLPGAWDMAGATSRGPVADADDLTLGTGNGGGAGNQFHGWLDDVTIWRTALSDETLKDRYHPSAAVEAPVPTLTKSDVPRGKVLVQISDQGMPDTNAWPADALPVTEKFADDAFGFFELPHKYVDTGVRGDRGNPLLMRAAAVVTLPAGSHRVLLRGRGASRLTVDGKLLVTTPFPPPGSDGHNPVRGPESYLHLGPDFRFAPPGNREAWAAFESPGGEHLVVLETIVGSYAGKSKRRPELSETVVAWSPAGSESWRLLAPTDRVIPYTDAGWEAYEAERSAALDAINAAARAAVREKNQAYWDKPRAAAKAWLAATPDVPVPPLPAGFPANNAVDHFLAARIAAVRAQTADAGKGTVEFFRHVQPILEAKCYDCHTGNKAKGGLRLDDRAAALKGGKADGPSIVPGKPADSPLIARVKSHDPADVMPPKGDRLTADQVKLLETWVSEGAKWPELNAGSTTLTPLTDDLTFLRRVTLDTVGVFPTPEEIAAFVADPSADKRAKAINRLLADPRAADHGMGYWLDVLAENPNILNPTLNNTGPFRWWVYESLRDNKPADLFVTELIRMEGSPRFGGPAGFGVASQNDVPMAQKGAIVAGGFLGVEMKCARCHDAPSHQSTQEDLFRLAALLEKKAVKVPATSSVPLDKIHQEGGRKPLIQVTLKPGTAVEPVWPFERFVPEKRADELAERPADPRDRLAALVTAPENERFAQVFANRVWKRLMGRGLVDPVEDWEKGKPTHPELLKWLGREFVRGGYDTRHLTRLVLTSHAYQRATDKSLKETGPLYVAPAPRRLTAEQVVDALFAATGKRMRVEEISLDVDGQRDLGSSLNLGKARRSWMLTSTSNERDRPSLALPRIQAVTDVLAAFGWRGARQDPTSAREQAPNVLQPAILSNGTMGIWLTRLSDDHGVTGLALTAKSADELLDGLFLRVLTRKPTDAERAEYVAYLTPGFAERVKASAPKPAAKREPAPFVTWTNHLHPRATVVRQQEELAARAGDPPTDRLDAAWRARLEDVLWAVLNSSEVVFTP